MNLTKNITYAEAIDSNTIKKLLLDDDPTNDIDNTPDHFQLNCIQNTANLIQEIRDYVNTIKKDSSVKFSSFFRCPALNIKIGGSATSQHCLGEAADFTVKNFSTTEIFKIIADKFFGKFDQCIWESKMQGGIRVYWIHLSYTLRRANRGELLYTYNGKDYTKLTRDQVKTWVPKY